MVRRVRASASSSPSANSDSKPRTQELALPQAGPILFYANGMEKAVA